MNPVTTRIIVTILLLAAGAPGQPGPAERVLIEVRNGDGSPAAGVPVVLLARRQPHIAPWEGRTWGPVREVLWRGRTDAGGRITRTAKEVLAELRSHVMWRQGPRYDDDQVWAALDVPGCQAPARLLSFCSKGGGAVRRAQLELPATGALEVHVRGRKGENPPGRLVADLHWTGPAGAAVGAVPVQEGRARFTHVVPGAALQAVIRDPRRVHRPSVPRAVDAPLHAGDTAAATVGPGVPYPVLKIRLVDPAGRPVALEPMSWSVIDGDAFLDSGHATTAADGSLFMTVRRQPLPDAGAPRLELWPGTPSYRLVVLPPPEALARAPLTVWPPRSGATDLGSLVLRPVPVLVRGRVVGSAGKPVAFARIEVRVTPKASSHPQVHQVDADREGRFAVHLDPSGLEEQVTLRVRAGGFREQELSLTANSGPQRIVMARKRP